MVSDLKVPEIRDSIQSRVEEPLRTLPIPVRDL